MFSEISKANEEKEKKIQEKINSYIDSSKSLVFHSGAGAGKTYALVESLKYIINNYGSSLSRHNQKILCITYTNVAADEMRERLGASQLVKISTIHERIWELIKEYKTQLIEIHKEKLLDKISIIEEKRNNHDDFKTYRVLSEEEKEAFQQIMLKQKDIYYKLYKAKAKEVENVFNPILIDFQELLSNKRNFRKIVDAIYEISDYKNCLRKINNGHKGYQDVIYNSNYNSDRLHKMQISHDTVLEYGLKLIQNYDLVKQIIIDQYPYILIDEYQDTSENVVKIMSCLSEYASKLNRKFFVGYFGDPVQSIYDDGVGNYLEEFHSNLKTVKKLFNRRSCIEIIEVTNKIRMDEIIQESIYDDATGGSVKFYYGIQDDVNTFIQKYLEEWDNSINCFFLTHKTVSYYSGFSDIYECFRKTKKYLVNYNQLTTELLSNDPTKLADVFRVIHNIVRFIEHLKSGDTPILEIYNDISFYKEITFKQLQDVLHLLKQIKGTSLGDYIKSISKVYQSNENTKLRKIIDHTIGLENITYESFHHFLLKELFPNIEDDELEEANQSLAKLLSINISSYKNWFQYIQRSNKDFDKVNYHTYHSTKGLEFSNVLIIMDNNFNRQKDFFSFYFKNYNNTENLDDKEMRKFEKARNLLYVACSRAIKNLRILYLDDISEIEENVTEIFGTPQKFNKSKEPVYL